MKNFGAVQRGADPEASGHQHFAVGEQGSRVVPGVCDHGAGNVPGSGSWVVELGALPGLVIRAISPGHQHQPVGQQGGRVMGAALGQRPGGAPGPGPALALGSKSSRTSQAAAPKAPGHQHLAVGQEGGRVTGPAPGQSPGDAPGPRGRVVEFGAV